jgi:hypothetical protein
MLRKQYVIMLITVFFIFCLQSIRGWAQESVEIINYQGSLSDTNGPMNGFHSMTFDIFDTKTPGSDLPLWSESHTNVQLSDGVFNILLGSSTPFPADLFDTNDDLYLRITVGGEDLDPLMHITSSAYAIKADTANHAHTATAANSVLDGTVTGNLLVDGRVGVGDESPNAEMHVVMTSGGTIPSLTPGLIVEDVPNNFGSRMEIRDESGVAEFRIDATGDVDIGGDSKLGIGIASPEARLHVQMPNGSIVNPSTVAGLIVTDSVYNSGNRLEIQDHYGTAGVVVDEAGRVGIGTAAPETALAVRGNVTVLSAATGDLILELGEGLDYAEGFDVTDERLEPGTVLTIDAENPGHLTMCRTAYDRKVAGIVAGARGLGSGVRLGGQQFDQDVALAGRVYCKVDATNESIQPGDLLTTSRVSGHAMKVADYSRAQGAVLGKAMEPLEKGGKGLILVLVTLQ